MWTRLRNYLLDQGLLSPGKDHRQVSGRICPCSMYGAAYVRITIGKTPVRTFQLGSNGRFRCFVPVRTKARVTIIMPGHLARTVEILPTVNAEQDRTSLTDPLELQVALTPLIAAHDRTVQPMMERITLADRGRPLIVERDHAELPGAPGSFVPMLTPWTGPLKDP